MERDKLAPSGATDSVPEKKVWAYAERVEKLRDSLLARIAAVKEQKESFPLSRENFKVRIRPMGTNLVSHDIIPFGMTQRFFVPTIQTMLENTMRNYPNRTILVEFWLHPYEIGGRKLHDDFFVQPLVTVPPQTSKKPQKKKVATESAYATELAEAVKLEAVTTATVEIEENLVAPVSLSLPPVLDPQFVEPLVKQDPEALAADIAAEILTEALAEEAAEDNPLNEEISPADSVPPAIPPVPAVSPSTLNIAAEIGLEANALDQPISYEYRDWNLYSTSPVPRKVKRVLEANGIYTPRKLIEVLGTDTPSYHEWYDFVQRINCEVEMVYRLGGGCAQDFLKWMRNKGYIASAFRAITPTTTTGR